MLLISKEETEKLIDNGLKFGRDIHTTHSGRKHKYYMTESDWCLKVLKNIRTKGINNG